MLMFKQTDQAVLHDRGLLGYAWTVQRISWSWIPNLCECYWGVTAVEQKHSVTVLSTHIA